LFNSTVLDVIIGLICAFLTVSLVTSAIVEAISSAMKWRAKTLLSGIQELVNDKDFKDLALKLYQHAAINPLGPGITSAPAVQSRAINAPPTEDEQKAAQERKPSYIDSKQFANALLDVTGLSAVIEKTGDPGPAAIKAFQDKINKITNPQIKDFFTGINNRTKGDLEKISVELGQWFDTE
jgi:hypothetical protein